MATAENKGEDKLWNSSVLSNKSWVEIMEEEEREQESANKGISPLRRCFPSEQNSSIRLCNGVNIKSEIKIEPVEDETAQDLGSGTHTDPSKLPAVDGLPTFGKTMSSNSLPKTPLKKEPTEVFQEDISLTGHLDGFKLVSPCKVDEKPQNDNKFKTPEKCAPNRLKTANCSSEGDVKQMGSCKRKLPGVKTDDAALMPSPNKISRISAASTPPNTVVNRKRLRDNLTPTPKKSPTKKKREPETDPEVLARRQKQIDYGKNTIGYERYRQLVPKESRTKMHPRTPPLNLKFSRRAWDGLVKVWRQRLHFWDPPSEGGGNPECADDDTLDEPGRDNVEEENMEEEDETKGLKKVHFHSGIEILNEGLEEEERFRKKVTRKRVKKKKKIPKKAYFPSEDDKIKYFKKKYGLYQKLPKTDEEISFFLETYKPRPPTVGHLRFVETASPIFLKYTDEGHSYPPRKLSRLRQKGKYSFLTIPHYKKKMRKSIYFGEGEISEEFELYGRKAYKDDEQLADFFETELGEFEGEQEEREYLGGPELASGAGGLEEEEEEEEESSEFDEKDPWFLQNLKLNMIALNRENPARLNYMKIALANYRTLDHKTRFVIEDILKGKKFGDDDECEELFKKISQKKTTDMGEELDYEDGVYAGVEESSEKVKAKKKKKHDPSEKLHAETIDRILYYNPKALPGYTKRNVGLLQHRRIIAKYPCARVEAPEKFITWFEPLLIKEKGYDVEELVDPDPETKIDFVGYCHQGRIWREIPNWRYGTKRDYRRVPLPGVYSTPGLARYIYSNPTIPYTSKNFYFSF